MTGFFAVAFAGVLISASQDGHAGNGAPVLEISLAKRQHLVAEPLILRLVLTNKSSEKMPRYFLDDEHLAITDVFLAFNRSGQSGVFQTRIAGLGVRTLPLRFRSPPTIEPGDSWQCERMIVPSYLDDDYRYTLLAAGHYRLSAKVPLPGSQPGLFVESTNALEVEITSPTGEEEKARALLGPNGMASFFLGEQGGKPEEIGRLLAEYPQSTYARYAQARLIMDSAKHWWDTRRPSSAADRDQLPALIAESHAYIQRYPDMPLNDNILLWCARLQHMAGDEEASARTLQQLFTDYPQSEVLQTARKHVEDWRRTHKAFESIHVPPPQTQPAIRSRGDDSLPRSRPAGTSTRIELTTKIRSTQPAAQPTTEPSAAAAK
jgi:hypothetical protein